MAFSKEEHFRNDTLKESVYLRTHSSGLPVYFCPKPGFRKRYACYATRFGSVDSSFRANGEERAEVPDGIAHFLEHKLFEGEDCNAFEKFSKYGASSNAYTGFTVTNYLFSCANDFFENLELLISFVREPYFTDENVEKEKGIIGQEIRMYDDDPGWRVFFNLLEALYYEHPIKKDIAGTTESIAKISKDLLYRCYSTFYQPANMILFAIGDESRDEFFAKTDEALGKLPEPARAATIERFFPAEPRAAAQRRRSLAMPVSMPRLLVGFKDNDFGYGGRRFLTRELATDVLLEILFGKASLFFQRLYEEKLIDDSFSSSYTGYVEAGHSLVGGETPDPERLAGEIEREVARVRRDGVPKADFERMKRAVMGRFFHSFNSLEFIANNYCAYRFCDVNLFDIIDVFHALSLADLERRLHDHLAADSMAISIILPRS